MATKPLVCQRHILGELLIKIHVDAHTINIESNKRIEHPSIGVVSIPQMSFGSINFGKLSHAVSELFADKHVYGLVSLVLDFIQSGKIDGKQCPTIVLWRKVRESETVYKSRLNKMGAKLV